VADRVLQAPAVPHHHRVLAEVTEAVAEAAVVMVPAVVMVQAAAPVEVMMELEVVPVAAMVAAAAMSDQHPRQLNRMMHPPTHLHLNLQRPHHRPVVVVVVAAATEVEMVVEPLLRPEEVPRPLEAVPQPQVVTAASALRKPLWSRTMKPRAERTQQEASAERSAVQRRSSPSTACLHQPRQMRAIVTLMASSLTCLTQLSVTVMDGVSRAQIRNAAILCPRR